MWLKWSVAEVFSITGWTGLALVVCSGGWFLNSTNMLTQHKQGKIPFFYCWPILVVHLLLLLKSSLVKCKNNWKDQTHADKARNPMFLGAIPGLFLFIFVLFKHKFYRKIVGVSEFQTRIVGEEEEHADHLTTTTYTALIFIITLNIVKGTYSPSLNKFKDGLLLQRS